MTLASPVARSLFESLSDIAPKLSAAGRVFLFLDFDGTLAPIVEDPADASMSPETRQHLFDLSQRARYLVSIVSGRALSDIQQRVGLSGLTYAGNHGFEISGPTLRFTEPAAAAHTADLEAVSRELETRLAGIPRARVENKGLTASVHYRGATESGRLEIRRIVNEVVGLHQDLFQITQGLEVLEIRPRVKWNKGLAANWILASFKTHQPVPVYLGDDTTDEDAFLELSSGITVRIGRTGETAAHYQLDYQEAVPEFLAWLSDFDDNLPQIPFHAEGVAQ